LKSNLNVRKNEIFAEAIRQYDVCMSCRFCVGFCPVWDALDRRIFIKPKNSVDEADAKLFAYLCHDCRNCYYACPYVEPHEFNLNIPKINSSVRKELNKEYAWPRSFSNVFGKINYVSSIAFLIFMTIFIIISSIFYQKNPFMVNGFALLSAEENIIILTGVLIGAYGLGILIFEGLSYWKDIAGNYRNLFDLRANIKAIKDVLLHRWFTAEGEGCDYPNEYPHLYRFIFHLLIFYGFILDLIATISAAIYMHFLGIPPPYGNLSLPVLTGMAGGFLIILGAIGLLVIKQGSNKKLMDSYWMNIDSWLLYFLILIMATGFSVNFLKNYDFSGIILIVHLSLVATLFVLIPYSKLVHIIFRYLALVEHYAEI